LCMLVCRNQTLGQKGSAGFEEPSGQILFYCPFSISRQQLTGKTPPAGLLDVRPKR
jgi:hypothetical protein